MNFNNELFAAEENSAIEEVLFESETSCDGCDGCDGCQHALH